jgi:hypothetical protein
MRELIVVGFQGMHRASEILNEVLALDAQTGRPTSTSTTRSPPTARPTAGCEWIRA